MTTSRGPRAAPYDAASLRRALVLLAGTDSPTELSRLLRTSKSMVSRAFRGGAALSTVAGWLEMLATVDRHALIVIDPGAGPGVVLVVRGSWDAEGMLGPFLARVPHPRVAVQSVPEPEGEVPDASPRLVAGRLRDALLSEPTSPGRAAYAEAIRSWLRGATPQAIAQCAQWLAPRSDAADDQPVAAIVATAMRWWEADYQQPGPGADRRLGRWYAHQLRAGHDVAALLADLEWQPRARVVLVVGRTIGQARSWPSKREAMDALRTWLRTRAARGGGEE